jgi:cephalosporin hydroxylase
MTPDKVFKNEVVENIRRLSKSESVKNLSHKWIREVSDFKWAYNFTWLGRPAIQFPNDAWAVQEIIWNVQPDLIIETGIAHGGSLILSASMLALLDMSDAISEGRMIDPKVSNRKVLGIDIDIRPHNRSAIEAHPMASRISMIQGSSIARDVIDKVQAFANDYKRIMVCLDSNHTHDHVLQELSAYAPLTSKGSYCIVFDTLIEDMPAKDFPDRPWGPGNNPKTAVREFLKTHPEFEIDKTIQDKLQITVAPDGFLQRMY